MARTVIEPAIGVPDGVRTEFQTSASYAPGSLRVFRNGQLQLARLLDGGFTELGGKKFRMKSPPEVGDIMQVLYVVPF